MTPTNDSATDPANFSANGSGRALLAFTPVPRQRLRKGGWSAERQCEFIAELADCGSVRAACRRMGVGEHHLYKLRRHPEGESFRAAWEAALDIGIQRIEDVAMDRALNGVEQPVYHKGDIIGTRRVYNDRLLMFMLRNRAPERFTEGQLKHGAKGLNAVGKMQMKRLKQQWRAEWEAERSPDGNGRSEDEVLEQLDTKLELMRQRYLAQMSPRTRAAFDRFKQLEAEDAAGGYIPYADPGHSLYTEARSQGDADNPVQLPPPGWHNGEHAEPDMEPDIEAHIEENPRLRGAKDEGWD